MTRYMYRGGATIRNRGIVLKFGDIVDQDHVAVKEGWNSMFPVSDGPGAAPAPAPVSAPENLDYVAPAPAPEEEPAPAPEEEPEPMAIERGPDDTTHETF